MLWRKEKYGRNECSVKARAITVNTCDGSVKESTWSTDWVLINDLFPDQCLKKIVHSDHVPIHLSWWKYWKISAICEVEKDILDTQQPLSNQTPVTWKHSSVVDASKKLTVVVLDGMAEIQAMNLC